MWEMCRYGMILDFDRAPSELSPADAATCVAWFSFLKAPLGAAVVLISKQMAPISLYSKPQKSSAITPLPRSSSYCPTSCDFHSTRVFIHDFVSFCIHARFQLLTAVLMIHAFCAILAETLLLASRQRRLESSCTRFLGAFAKLRKATVSFVMTACMFVRVEQPGSHWTDFHEILYLSTFRKICRENSSFFKHLTRMKGALH